MWLSTSHLTYGRNDDEIITRPLRSLLGRPHLTLAIPSIPVASYPPASRYLNTDAAGRVPMDACS
jgi:hypothetical protein